MYTTRIKFCATPPWSVDELEAYFVVRDHNGQQLAYVYFEEEPGRRSVAKLLTKDEARRDRGEYRQAAGANLIRRTLPVRLCV